MKVYKRIISKEICPKLWGKSLHSLYSSLKFFPPQGATENLKVAGNFPVERSRPERPHSRQLSERSGRNWMPRSGSET